ncbi:MAG: DUF4097 family beta strand repeat protein [Clostridia bacterium]|nr:DUF4097 family beta strand repeat protein [Clostridia bacterium]
MKRWMIVAVVLMVLGCVSFAVSFAAAGFDFLSIDSEVLVDQSYSVEESFHSIRVEDDIADVRLVLASENRVECKESDRVRYSVEVKNQTLVIRAVDLRKWYNYLGFSFSDRAVTVYLTEDFYRYLSVETDTGDVNIPEGFTFENANLSSDTGLILFCAKVSDRLHLETDTGNIRIASTAVSNLESETDTGSVEIKNVSVGGDLSLETDTGKIRMTDVTCGRLVCESDTGDMILTRVLSVGLMSLLSDTGDLQFDACDAPSVRIRTATGDVEGTFCSDKIFSVTTDTGDVDVPKSFSGGPCEIVTSTGDVNLRISSSVVP